MMIIKPTVGLISRSGIIPISCHQDTAGPMARNVSDAAILLGILAGQDDDDALTSNSRDFLLGDYTPYLDKQGLHGARIGVVRQHWPNDHHIEQLLDNSIAAMRDCGAEIIDTVSLLSSDTLRSNERQVMLYEFKAGLNAYLKQLGDHAPQRNLADIIKFNQRYKDQTMPYFQQELLLAAQATSDLSDPHYQQALQINLQQAREQGIDKTLQQYGLDAIIMPTTSSPWLIDCINGDNRSGSAACLPAVAGYPHITVPAGYVYGLPVGLSFIGGSYQEPLLIKLAYAFEQATQVRHPPGYQTTISF